MCGIFVAYSRNGPPLPLERCKNALDNLAHRGPDFKFDMVLRGGSLYMGQTVLSITGCPGDKMDRYHTSKCGRYSAVLNGEIYNFRDLQRAHLPAEFLPTDSDTELLVNLYSSLSPSEIASRLRGMYVYCVYDRQAECLYVSRDLIGEKVIYRAVTEDAVILCSEPSVIVEYLGEYQLNKNVISRYFFTRHLLTPHETVYNGVYTVPAGVAIRHDLASGSMERIYTETLGDLISPDRYEHYAGLSEEEVSDELDGIFQKTARALCPQVDYASVFSGGVDSSLASYYMQHCAGRAPAAYIAQRFGEKDPIANQLGEFSKKFGAEIIVLDTTISEYTDAMARYFDRYKLPMGTHSFVSQMLLASKIRQLGYKVLIGGDGGDELFGGYELYKSSMVRGVSMDENPSPYSGYVNNALEIPGFDCDAYREEKRQEWLEALKRYEHIAADDERACQAALYLDASIQLESVGLRSSDLMSMASSVEGRSFFVARDVLEMAVNLPIKYKIFADARDEIYQTKPILKRLFARHFGDALLFQKQGYSGYPNEAGKAILGIPDCSRVSSLLGIRQGALTDLTRTKASEWKLINLELFLERLSLDRVSH